jgi:hypothetical protein
MRYASTPKELDYFFLNHRIFAIPFRLWPQFIVRLSSIPTFPDLSELLIAFLVS